MATKRIRPQALSRPQSLPISAPKEWLAVAGLDLAQAERLLDWLENHGCQRRHVSIESDRSFVDRYRPREAGEGFSPKPSRLTEFLAKCRQLLKTVWV
jgi:hypothetical protein